MNRLHGETVKTGLTVLAAGAWPETDADAVIVPPPLAGFVVSSFSPLAAEAARRCLGRRAIDEWVAAEPTTVEWTRPVTAVILVSSLGDVTSAVHVADAVDSGSRVGPLLFFQSVPNAVAGHLAARWRLTGPVVCVGGLGAGLEIAALLIEDGDAEEALLVRIEQTCADAVLLGAGFPSSEGEDE